MVYTNKIKELVRELTQNSEQHIVQEDYACLMKEQDNLKKRIEIVNKVLEIRGDIGSTEEKDKKVAEYLQSVGGQE